VARGVEIDQTNAPAVASICRRLDGLPLAIELAAAGVGLLTPGEIDERLDDRFRLLSGGTRTDPRHRTLRALIEWSHDLLDDEETILYLRLGVFVGGFTLEAAEQVCSSQSLTPNGVLTCSGSCWRSPSSRLRTRRGTSATGCWRQSVATRWSASAYPGRSTSSARGTWRGSCRSLSGPT
jgi:hypothetical protein